MVHQPDDYYLQLASAGRITRHPQGPAAAFDPSEPDQPKKAQRGGSYLCTTSIVPATSWGRAARGKSVRAQIISVSDVATRARFSLDETLDFGEDTGTPVVEHYAAKMPFKFTGKLDKFVIRLTENKLTVAEERELTDLTRRAGAVRQ